MQDSNKFTFEELIKNNPEGTERLLKDVMRQKPGVDWERLTVPILMALIIFFAVLIGLEIIFPHQIFDFFEKIADKI